jgi:hypothetical protein
MLITLSGCGDTKQIDGITYDTYGLFNESNKRNPDIHYNLIMGNVIWGILLCETIIAPIYFFGFSLYEPVNKNKFYIKGAIQ